jgi:hypothetical protein
LLCGCGAKRAQSLRVSKGRALFQVEFHALAVPWVLDESHRGRRPPRRPPRVPGGFGPPTEPTSPPSPARKRKPTSRHPGEP